MTIPWSRYKAECLSEMVGTYLLVLIGPASVVAASLIAFPSPFEALAFVALVFGSVVFSVILLLGRHSGAHINPAITVAHAFAGIFDRELFVPYVAFQVAGGLLAGLTLKIVLGSIASTTDLGSTKLAVGVSPIEGITLEIVGTFVLAFSALSASSFIKTPFKQALLVGTTLFILIMLIGPLTGASFNPARTLGPSVFSEYFNSELVYWFGPLVGAALAGLIFGMVRKPRGRANGLPLVSVC